MRRRRRVMTILLSLVINCSQTLSRPHTGPQALGIWHLVSEAGDVVRRDASAPGHQRTFRISQYRFYLRKRTSIPASRNHKTSAAFTDNPATHLVGLI